MSDVILRVDADTRQAEAKIGKLGDKSINLNVKNFNQPLGKITGQLGEFEKSLEASNARVIAFGASAGAIYAIQNALAQTVKSAIDVEKSLTDINVILNLSSESLSKFGATLFDIAKNTGNSFKTVADAATELSRQGLGVEETLKRTQDALILTRLSGLSAVDAVEALTATINGFSKEALNSSTIVNKFAAVDAAFAVSSADLAEAIKRVGSSASDAGISLDQLIAIVTTAQQITARGGSVIGNSFKTIFTRLQRPKVLDSLEGIGIATRDAQGNFLPLINILQDLAKTYDNLNSVQKASIAETVGGVFQINILKAALSDLGKEYSIYGRALEISNSATNEAASRNEALNKTFSSLLNKTVANLTQAGAKIGGETFQPGIEKILNSLNSFLEDFSSQDTESFGAKIAQGLVKGIGSFLSGPGILLAGKALFMIFERLAVFSADALKTILGLNAKAAEQAQIQRQIFDLLSKNPEIIAQINQGSLTVEQTQSIILKTIQEQTAAMQQQIGLAKTLAASLSQAGVSIATSGIAKGRIQTKYAGYIPNFANQDQLIENIGAAQHGYKAGKAYRKTLYDGYGGSFPAVVNSAETVKTFTNSIGKKATIVEPPNGFARGYIPNFAKKIAPEVSRGKTADFMTYTNAVSMIYPKKSPITSAMGFGKAMGKTVGVKFNIAGFNPKLAVKPEDSILEKQLGNTLVQFTNDFIQKIFSSSGNDVAAPKINNIKELSNAGSFGSIVGTVFETAVDYATGRTNADRSQNASIDFMNPSEKLKELFQNAPGIYEAKNNALPSNLDSTAQKIINNGFLPANIKEQLGKQYIEESKAFRIGEEVKAGLRKKPGIKKSKFGGFIPNFAALEDAVSREKNAGINPSSIRVGSDSRLVSNSNPLGLGVYNTKDEPMGLKQGVSRNKSSGYVPNFAQTASKVFDPQFRQNVQMASDRAFIKAAELELPLNKLKTKVLIATDNVKKFGEAALKPVPSFEKYQGKLLGASIGLSVLSGQLREFGGDNKLTNFGAALADSTSTFLTITQVLPGQVGIFAGGLLAAGSLIEKTAKDFQNSVEEDVIKSAEKTKEDFTRFSDAGQRYLTALENYTSALDSGNIEMANKANSVLANTLLEIDAKYREELAGAKTMAAARDIYTKISEEKGKTQQGAEIAKDIAKLSEERRVNAFKQAFGFLFRDSGQTRGEPFGIFTGKEAKGKGFEESQTYASRTLRAVNNDFFKALDHNLVDTSARGEDFIRMLKDFGAATELTTQLTETMKDNVHGGALQIQLFARDFFDAAIKANDERRKRQKEILNKREMQPFNSIISQAAVFTKQQNLKELEIGKRKGALSAYGQFMPEEAQANIESQIKQDEIRLEHEKDLLEISGKYNDNQAELNRLTDESNQKLQQSLALEQQRLGYQLKQIEAKRALTSMGGMEGLFDQKPLLESMSRVDELQTQIEGMQNPVAKAGAQLELINELKKQGYDFSGKEYTPLLKEIASNAGMGTQGLYAGKARTTTDPFLSKVYQNLAQRAPEETTLKVANLTENYDLLTSATENLTNGIVQTTNSLGLLNESTTNVSNTIGGLNQRTTNTEKQEFKGTIDVQLSPLVIQLGGNVTSELDPVNQKIIDAMRETISQLEAKVNSLGLLQSKIGPPSK